MIIPHVSVSGDRATIFDLEGIVLDAFDSFVVADNRSPNSVVLLDLMGATEVSIDLDLAVDHDTQPLELLDRADPSAVGERLAATLDSTNIALGRAFADGQWEYLQLSATVSIAASAGTVGHVIRATGIKWSSIGDLLWDDPNSEGGLIDFVIRSVQTGVGIAAAKLGDLQPEGVYDTLCEELRKPPDPRPQIEQNPF